jgi:hypothetical protein
MVRIAREKLGRNPEYARGGAVHVMLATKVGSDELEEKAALRFPMKPDGLSSSGNKCLLRIWR